MTPTIDTRDQFARSDTVGRSASASSHHVLAPEIQPHYTSTVLESESNYLTRFKRVSIRSQITAPDHR